MIKTGIEDIPDIKGLVGAITKKQSEIEFLNDLKKVPQVYVQDVYQFHSDDIVPHSNDYVKWDLENTSKTSETDGLKSQFKDTQKDTEYLDAVNRGDMETAQRMVDEAAERAFKNSVVRDSDGNLMKVYHGSPEHFNVFKGKERGAVGNYFSPWRAFAEDYGEVRAFYVNLTNPTLYDYDWEQLNDVDEADGDGIIYAAEDMDTIDPDEIGDTEIIVYDSNSIKSADPVTYDDDGNIIPLSERFNVENKDIRFQKKEVSNRTILANALETTYNI